MALELFSINDENSLSVLNYNKLFPTINKKKDMIQDLSWLFWNSDAANHLSEILRKKHYGIIHNHNVHSRLSHSITKVAVRHGLKAVVTLHDFKYICPHYTLLRNGRICSKCSGGKFYNAALYRCHKNSYLKKVNPFNEKSLTILEFLKKRMNFTKIFNFVRGKKLLDIYSY